jgi:hypothetical protein
VSAPLALIADPVETTYRAWLPWTYAIGAHLETCAACRDDHACSTGLRLREDEERAFQALERARESQL